MNKLKLDLETLHVESFASSTAAQEHGTVRGHDASWTQPVYNTCQFTCGQTVRYTVCNTNPCQ
jgi:hypothetical protein